MKARDHVVEMLERHRNSCGAINAVLRDAKFSYFGEHYVREFMAPALRTAACHEALEHGLIMLLAKLDPKRCTSEGNIMLLRMLGEQLQAPYATIDDRDKIYAFIMGFAFNSKPENLKNKKIRVDFAILSAKSGFIAALIRVVSAPLRPGLSQEDKVDFEYSRNEWAHWLAVLLSILISEVPESQSAPLLDQIESEVIAASPWIWKELERYGCEWVNIDEESLCCAAYLIQTLCIISSKVYASAKEAGIELAFNNIAKRMAHNPAMLQSLQERFKNTFQAAALYTSPGNSSLKPNMTNVFIEANPPLVNSNTRRRARRKLLFPETAFDDLAELDDCIFGSLETSQQASQQAQQRSSTAPAARAGASSSSFSKMATKEETNNSASETKPSSSSVPSVKLPGKKSTSCGHCGISAAVLDKKLLLCSGCKLQRYCSAQCQKDDWKMHKKACKEAQKQAEAE